MMLNIHYCRSCRCGWVRSCKQKVANHTALSESVLALSPCVIYVWKLLGWTMKKFGKQVKKKKLKIQI